MLRCLDQATPQGIILLSKVLARLDKWDEASEVHRSHPARTSESQKRTSKRRHWNPRDTEPKSQKTAPQHPSQLKITLTSNAQTKRTVGSTSRSLFLNGHCKSESRACALVTGVTIALLFVSWQIDTGTSNAAEVEETSFNDSELPIS